MPATKDQMGRTVSMDYGQKGQFMDALQGPGSGSATGGAGPAAGAPAVAPGPDDPLGLMLGGAIPPSGQPLTEGLSVGPGAGPVQTPAVTDDIVERLRMVAMHAKTPTLRAMARAALHRRIKSNGVW